MFGETFYWIANMSIIASVTGGIILLLRMIRRIPARVRCLFWLVPSTRMVIPFGINSSFSLIRLLNRFMTRTVDLVETKRKIEASFLNSIQAAESYFPIVYVRESLRKLFDAAAVVWLIGFTAIVLTIAVLYCSTIRELRTAVHLKEDCYISDLVQGPAVYGIFRPKIVLNPKDDNQENPYVLLHERMHIRRMDNLWRLLAFLVTAVHWFNPLAWLFLKLFLQDIELACDECVLQRLNKAQHKEYALTLLRSRESQMVFLSAFGGAKLRTRIENIVSFRKMTWISLLGCVLLLGTVFLILLTNAG